MTFRRIEPGPAVPVDAAPASLWQKINQRNDTTICPAWRGGAPSPYQLLPQLHAGVGASDGDGRALRGKGVARRQYRGRMGRVFTGAGAAFGFIGLVVLLALGCAEWRLAAAGPRDAQALAERLGDSSFAPPRSYTLASLSPGTSVVIIDGGSDSDSDTTGSLGAATERATFDERFKAGFLYYELEEEAGPGSEPRV